MLVTENITHQEKTKKGKLLCWQWERSRLPFLLWVLPSFETNCLYMLILVYAFYIEFTNSHAAVKGVRLSVGESEDYTNNNNQAPSRACNFDN